MIISIVSYFHMYPLSIIGKQFYHLYIVSIKFDIFKHETHMGDATECINPIGYALFAVIKAIFSNPNGLEMIMDYILKWINKLIKYKTKKQGTVTELKLATSMTVDKRFIHYATNSPCDWYVPMTLF